MKKLGKFGDWGAFLGAIGIAVTNYAGVRDAIVEALKAFHAGADHTQAAIRKLLGKHLAKPLARIIVASALIAVLLAGCTLATASEGTLVLRGALIADLGVTGLLVWMLLRFSETQTQRVPLVMASVSHVLTQIALAGVAVACACMAQSMLALLFASLLAAVALLEALIYVVVMWGMVAKVVAVLALAEKAALSPAALAPVLEIENYTEFLKPIIIGISDVWRERPVLIVGKLVGSVGIFLVLLSFYPSVGWAAIVGAIMVPLGVMSALAQAFYDLSKDVKESQKKTVWLLYRYAWIPVSAAVALRVVCAFSPELNNTVSAMPKGIVKWCNDFIHGRNGIAGGFGFWQATGYLLAALVVLWIFVAATKNSKRDWLKNSLRAGPLVFSVYYVLAMTNSCVGGKYKGRGLNPFNEDPVLATSATSSSSPSSSTSSAPPPPTASATTSATPVPQAPATSATTTATASASASVKPAATNKPMAQAAPRIPRPGQLRNGSDAEASRDLHGLAKDIGVE